MADRNQMKMTSKNERDSKAHSYRAVTAALKTRPIQTQ